MTPLYFDIKIERLHFDSVSPFFRDRVYNYRDTNKRKTRTKPINVGTGGQGEVFVRYFMLKRPVVMLG